MKHKHSIMSTYEEAEKQGKTIMFFTVATIVFVSPQYLLRLGRWPGSEPWLMSHYLSCQES